MLGQHWIIQTNAMFEARRLGTKHISFLKNILCYKIFKEYFNSEEEKQGNSTHATRFQDLL